MASPLHISTDRVIYTVNEDVIVTASLDQWNSQAKIKLVIWIAGGTTPIIAKNFSKPANSNIVTWTVPASTFTTRTLFNAQIEFGNEHTYTSFNH